MTVSGIICTVGTSLISAVSRVDKDRNCGLKKFYDSRDWSGFSNALNLVRQPCERVCGAEINSTFRIIDAGLVPDSAHVYLLYSDSEDGKVVSDLIAGYMRTFSFSGVETRRVKNLSLDVPSEVFVCEGLFNLACCIKEIADNYPPGRCIVNATGGFKAQTGIALVSAFAGGIPVYYMHEKMGEIVCFREVFNLLKNLWE